MGYGLGAGFDLPPPAATRLTQAWLDPELARDSEVALGKVLTCAAWCETRMAFRSFRIDHIIQLQLDAHSFKDEAGKTFAKFLRQVNQRPNALARVSEKKCTATLIKLGHSASHVVANQRRPLARLMQDRTVSRNKTHDEAAEMRGRRRGARCSTL